MKLEKTTLSDQIYQLLRTDIITQKLPGGEKLTIKMIQERFSTSYTPAREALRRLAQEGLVESVTNVGASVIALTKDDVREIYDFCFILDHAAMSLAMENPAFPEFISDIRENLLLQENALADQDLTAFKKYSDDFHDIFFRYCRNRRLYHSAKLLRSQLSILTNNYQMFSIATGRVIVEHKKIANALQEKNLPLASGLLKEHFGHEKHYMLNQYGREAGTAPE